jgi:pimeloyl-ACP methyl ester carboxylesterase
MARTGFEDIKTAKVNGTTLAYREVGEGEPVVFVHGAISDLRTWKQQIGAVGSSYRAIAYSRRFCRPSERSDPGGSDLSLLAVEDLAAFVREIGAAPAHLVGNSYGAYVSLVTAIRYPELVRTVVAEEPPVLRLFVSVPPRPTELLRLLVTRPRTAIGIVQFGAGTMAPVVKLIKRGEESKAARVFTRGVLGKRAFDRLSQERWDQIHENLFEMKLLERDAEVFPPIDDDGVRGIRVPVLLVVGEQSPLHLRVLVDRLEELLPDVERVEIPDASHLMHEDNAAAVNEVILGFLDRSRSQAGLAPSS